MEDRRRQVEEFAQEWTAAELRGDAAFLKGALTEDFVGIGPLGFVLNKEQWLSRYQSGDLVYESFTLDEVEARFYGEAAVVTCRQSQAGTYQGQAVDVMQGEFRATLVFVEREERWLLASLHLSPIARMSSRR